MYVPEHRHLILGALPLIHQLGVPMPDEQAVRVHLHDEGLTSIHAVADVSGGHRPGGHAGVHLVDGDLGAILADGVVGVFIAGDINVQATMCGGVHESMCMCVCEYVSMCVCVYVCMCV